MGLLNLCVFLILIESPSLADSGAHLSGELPPPPTAEVGATSFKPSIAIIVGVITTIFSITFLVLLYIKHCRRAAANSANSRNRPISRENSGINRKVIESLPMFRFSSLRGQKDGLECAVCLNKFDGEEVLRLLPKCKHAFHVECVDTWLDAHSTCPLCRYRVEAEDVLFVDGHERRSSGGGSGRGVANSGEIESNAAPRSSGDNGKGNEYVNRRISGRHSSAGEHGGTLEIIVENSGHGRASLDSSRKTVKSSSENWRRYPKNSPEVPPRLSLDGRKFYRKDGQLPVHADKHRLEHRIIISEDGDTVDKEEARQQWRRWSDVEAPELLYLRSEMILGEGEGSGRRAINTRSVSEMTLTSRYRSNSRARVLCRERKEEGVVKRWLDWVSDHRRKPAVISTSPPPSSAIVV